MLKTGHRTRYHLRAFEFLASRGRSRAVLTCTLLTAFLATMPTGGLQAGDILRGGASAGNAKRNSEARANAGAAAAEAAKVRAQDRLARTTKAVNDMRALQTSARSAAGANSIPNGLTPGGLELRAGHIPTGANAPTASGNNVNIKQNASQALLEWETFNVGSQTTVNFDQSAGGADSGKWIAFNKVSDPTGKPSEIRGKINAQGQVYILNRNGIIFGAGSQVNARTLVGSSLPINDELVARGLINQEANDPSFLFSALPADGFDPLTPNAKVGDVSVERGAILSAPVSPEGYGGRVTLIGKNVTNAGTISTEAGQTILAAGLQVAVDAHATSDPSLRGLDVYIGEVEDATLGEKGGTVLNQGLIESQRGNISLAGRHVRQHGVLESTTSVDVNGRIDLLANYKAVANKAYNPTDSNFGLPFLNQSTGYIELGSNSVQRILPEYASEKTVASAMLPLRSMINIRGQSIYLASGVSLLAPNAAVSIDAGKWVRESSKSTFVHSGGQVYIDSGALIDISGSTDIFVPLSHSILDIQLRGSELADSPLQRSSNLRGVNLTIDMRKRGTYNGREWVGTPLGDVSGYLNLIERNVGQLTLEGGDLSISAGSSVVIRSGATIDASGGFSNSEGGIIRTTRLHLDRGLVDISQATPDRIYGSILNGITSSSSTKWGVTKRFLSPLSPLGSFQESARVSGANAGTIEISAASIALDGDLSAKRITGPRQLRSGSSSTTLARGGALTLRFEAQDDTPGRSVNPFGKISPFPPNLTFAPSPAQPDPGSFTLGENDSPSSISDIRKNNVVLSSALLDEERFTSLTIKNSDGETTIKSGSPITIPADGTLDISSSNILIDTLITAPSGNILFSAYTFSPYQAAFLDQSKNDTLPSATLSRGIISLSSTSQIDASGTVIDDRSSSPLAFLRPIAKTGGSIQLKAHSIALAQGSILDVSGGMVAKQTGKFSWGNGGSISIQAGQDPALSGIIGGKLEMAATLRGYSGAQGGSLSLKAGQILIKQSGALSTGEVLELDPTFFNQGGFQSFTLTGIGSVDKTSGKFLPALVIQSGVLINPKVESYSYNPKLIGNSKPFRTLLKPDGVRDPVDLSFRGTGAKDNLTNIAVARGDIIVEQGSKVTTDPLGSISFDGQTVSIAGTIEAPAGKILVQGADDFPQLVAGPTALATVHLTPTALLSAKGAVVTTPDPYGRRRGGVLPGGLITIKGNIVAESGALLDVSGTSGVLDLTPQELGLFKLSQVPPTSGLVETPHAIRSISQVVQSNGGTIILRGSKLLASDASLLGKPGGPNALGGALSASSGRYVPPSQASTSADINLIVTQDGASLGSGEIGIGLPGIDGNGNPMVGLGYFRAESFARGEFSTLELGGNIRFEGPITISADRALLLAEGGVIQANNQVDLTAPYISVGQAFPKPLRAGESLQLFSQTDKGGTTTEFFPSPSSGSGSLSLNAELIDIGTLLLKGISTAEISARNGDIRGNGILTMAGALNLIASRIYPTTAADFEIFVYDNTLSAASGSLSVRSAGSAIATPLSAGGSLKLLASEITLGSALFAPLGTIRIGWDGLSDKPVNPLSGADGLAMPIANRVTLLNGALVSVSGIDSLSGQDILFPYGMSPDGVSWLNPSGDDINSSGLPEKSVNIQGSQIDIQANSMIDIRGGGDIYAYQWTQGPGGFNDILESDTSFAILPKGLFNQAPLAPFNQGSTNLLGQSGYHNDNLFAGDAITFKQDGPLPAGTYTLLPARYALLPGAYLVTPFNTIATSSSDPLASFASSAPQTISLEDGSWLVNGSYDNRFTLGRGVSPITQSFRLLNGEGVRAQSEYKDFYGNSFLKTAAAKAERSSQRLPEDGGTLRLLASSNLMANGNVQAISIGRGSIVDIASSGDMIISSSAGVYITTGDSILSAQNLSNWNAGSLLIGGYRDGNTIKVRTSNIILDNATAALTASEIILVSTKTLTLEKDSKLVALNGNIASNDLLISGDGALLRTSSGAGTTVTRSGFAGLPTSAIQIGQGASISGDSIVLDSTYQMTVNASAGLNGKNFIFNAGRVSFLLGTPTSTTPSYGLIISKDALESLQSATSVKFLSYSSLDFYGSGELPLGQGGALSLQAGSIRGFDTLGGEVLIKARSISLDNLISASAVAPSSPVTGSLRFDAETFTFGGGNLEFSQFQSVQINAANGFAFSGIGSLAVLGGSLGGVVAEFSGSGASNLAISSSEDVSFLRTGLATSSLETAFGASLSIEGRDVTLESNISLLGGRFSVLASRNLSIDSTINLKGGSLSFYDVSRSYAGGAVTLKAGSNLVAKGAIDVSSGSGSDSAGSISISATSGLLDLSATLAGSSNTGNGGGFFNLDSLAISSVDALDVLNARLDAGGFSGSRSFRSRTGNLLFSGSAKASRFSMFADDGDISISGKIDASGRTGGVIQLAAHGNLALLPKAELSVAANQFDSAGKGGAIILEAGASRGGTSGGGTLTLSPGSKLDLSVALFDQKGAGTSAAAGQFQGSLHLRVPRTADNKNLLLNPIDASIIGASKITVEGFAVRNLNQAGSATITTAIRIEEVAKANTFGNESAALANSLLISNPSLQSAILVQPGIEIVNTRGGLTLDSNWDLSATRFGSDSVPGILTLKSQGDLVFNGSLSDGFSGGSSLYLSPLSPFNSNLPANAQSWSYRLTGGSDLSAADFRATVAGSGSILIGKNLGNAFISNPGKSLSASTYIASNYQAIRTGTGDIFLSSGSNIYLLNQFATIYTAGSVISNPTSLFTANDFLVPDTLNWPTQSDNFVLGKQPAIYAPSWSMAGGNVDISAQGDIARMTYNKAGQALDDSSRQLPMNWLYRRSYVDPVTGEFGRSGVQFNTRRVIDDPYSSTTWWVDFSNFFEGVGTLGGGNIRLAAGQDIRNIDAAAPTNLRSPKGIPDTTKFIELGGGDISITAGRNMIGGVYYAEKGVGTIKVAGKIGTDQTRSPSLGIVGNDFNLSNPSYLDQATWLPTTFFAGRSNFSVQAGGDILLGPTVNPFLLPQGIGNKYWYKTWFSTFNSEACTSVLSLGGDVLVRNEVVSSNGDAIPVLQSWMNSQHLLGDSPTSAAYYQPWLRLSESSLSAFSDTLSINAPNLNVTAMTGSITFAGDVDLFPSPTGNLEVISSTGIVGLAPLGTANGAKFWKSAALNLSDANPASLPSPTSPINYISFANTNTTTGLPTAGIFASTTGDFLASIKNAFNESGSYTGSFALVQTKQALHYSSLLHKADPNPVRLYASHGDLSGLTLYSPKATKITTSGNIEDIAFYIQNLSSSDISSVSAGGDLLPYNANTASRTASRLPGNIAVSVESPGDLQISGPGSFEVIAGGDLDLGTGDSIGSDLGQGITSIGNARNPYLPFEGASLFVVAGIGPAAGLSSSLLNFEAFLSKYLEEFEGELGVTTGSQPVSLQARAELALRILPLVLKSVGRSAAETQDYTEGFQAIDTLLDGLTPSGNLEARARSIRTRSGGEINIFVPGGELALAKSSSTVASRPEIAQFAGTDLLKLVSTSTSIAAPAGIVTEYGGAVNIATDGDVSIGNGRIFTLRGGDIVIWSSEGDIAAGAAAKTVATAPPTRVLIDPVSATIETDLSGLATGGGIGVLSTVEGTEPGDVDLIAPSGFVDAGDAGIRASGNLNIAAVQVLNADNISVSGSSSGVPASAPPAAPNVGGLSAGSSATAATSSAANQVTDQAQSKENIADESPSFITVEVLGYGGGEGDSRSGDDEEEKEG